MREVVLLLIVVLSVPITLGGYAYAADCNNNGVDDSIDIANHTSNDCNGNGIPDECDVSGRLYAGTVGSQGQPGRVFVYRGGYQWEDISPIPQWGAATVMSLVFYNGHLYGGVQTQHGMAGANGDGQVWRYDGGNTWTLVKNQMDSSVTVLQIYSNKLYAGTGSGYVYRCSVCDGTDWGNSVAHTDNVSMGFRETVASLQSY